MAKHKWMLEITDGGDITDVLYFPTRESATKYVGKSLSRVGFYHDGYLIKKFHWTEKVGKRYILKKLFENWEEMKS